MPWYQSHRVPAASRQVHGAIEANMSQLVVSGSNNHRAPWSSTPTTVAVHPVVRSTPVEQQRPPVRQHVEVPHLPDHDGMVARYVGTIQRTVEVAHAVHQYWGAGGRAAPPDPGERGTAGRPVRVGEPARKVDLVNAQHRHLAASVMYLKWFDSVSV